MKLSVIIGTSLLALAWIWLVWVILSSAGLSIKNLLIVVMSGIIIFVPLWKKYFRSANRNSNE